MRFQANRVGNVLCISNLQTTSLPDLLFSDFIYNSSTFS